MTGCYISPWWEGCYKCSTDINNELWWEDRQKLFQSLAAQNILRTFPSGITGISSPTCHLLAFDFRNSKQVSEAAKTGKSTKEGRECQCEVHKKVELTQFEGKKQGIRLPCTVGEPIKFQLFHVFPKWHLQVAQLHIYITHMLQCSKLIFNISAACPP